MYLHNKALVCLNLALFSLYYDLALELIMHLIFSWWFG